MAILASRRRHAVLARNRMLAVGVSLLSVRMALPAGYLLRRSIVHKALHIRVAIDASKEAPVDSVLQLRLIHEQAQRLPVHIGSQCGIRMAGQAVGIFKLLSRIRRVDTDKQG